MARKEFNVFSISFLDLLSGALASMIIMFIIIPKMSEADTERNEEMQRITERMAELNVSLEDLQRIQAIQESDEAMEVVRQLEEAIIAMQREQEQMQQRLEELERQNQALQQQVSESNAAGQVAMDGVKFGVNAEFAWTAVWRENLDVDLYLRNRRDGTWCSYSATHTPFAKYLADIQARDNVNANSYEVIYQEQLIPGEYDAYLHLYSSSGMAQVKSQLLVHPGTRRERTMDLGVQRIAHSAKPPEGGGLYIATIRVTSQDVQIVR